MNPNDSNPAAITSQKQVSANQQNALRSTGPKTPAGKLAVAKNGINHGIYTLSPVIQGVESVRDWKPYREAMLARLQPSDGLEMMLAERIVLNAWRLRRVVRYEIERIRLVQEQAMEVVVTELSKEVAEPGNTAFQNVEYSLPDVVFESGDDSRPAYGEDVRDDAELSDEDAKELLSRVHDKLGWTDRFPDYWRQFQKPETWTAKAIRDAAAQLADEHYKSCWGQIEKEEKRRLGKYRRKHLLPDEETLEKVMRYETHLSRQFHRDLHELQRLQAVRQGKAVAAPIAIDVDVSSGPKEDMESTG